MYQFLKTSSIVILLVVLALSGGLTTGVVSAQERADFDPNTPVSEDGVLPMPESYGIESEESFTGTGKRMARPMQIPEAHLNAKPIRSPLESAMESVIGADGRTRITSTTAFPNRAIVYLYVKFSSVSAGTCTGWLIGNNTVVTAGHCVYDTSTNKWAQSITVYPGRNGTSAPYGYAMSTKLYSVTGWTVSENWEYDYGVIKTGTLQNAGANTGKYPGTAVGFFGYRWQSSNTFANGPYTVRGYPGDKTSGTLWTMSGAVNAFKYNNRYFKLWYTMDTYGGQSGSPIYHYLSGSYYGVGIHAYGASSINGGSYNSGTRITETVFNNLKYWKGLP